MTEQEIFDTVARHLLKQGRPAMDGLACRYRAPDGLKCAVGVLIADEEYKPEMDASDDHPTGVADLDALGLLPARLAAHLDLLTELQSVHDSASLLDDFFVERIKQDLRTKARRHGLDPAVLDAEA